ncbi:Exocyst complex component 4 [Hypsibius exemplaris]|uniref:Exocyst complex component Sec8 n=1 Tax=Hypsibius exemplaris TaxID=2072580 RepID=A0A1W0X8U7_HYPEX|nr:Exocyst complex component 4 [Hypsibius exemplaris]
MVPWCSKLAYTTESLGKILHETFVPDSRQRSFEAMSRDRTERLSSVGTGPNHPHGSRETGSDLRPGRSAHLLHDFMRSVATIAAFEGAEKKDKERSKIERDYRRCDEHLSSLIEQKRDELTTSAATFTQVVARLASIKGTSETVRNTLLSAKDHLRGKQDDMKALWLQSVELQEELKLLNSIDRVKDLPAAIKEAMGHQKYLEAAQYVVEGLEVVNGKLGEVEAVSNVRSELLQERDNLTDLMLRQLGLFLYIRTTSSVLKKISRRTETISDKDDEPVIPIATVVRCLHDVSRLVEAMRNNYHALGDKLQHVFLHTTETLHAIHYVELLQNKDRPELLEQLVKLLLEQFGAVAAAHHEFLEEVNRVRFSANVDPVLGKSLVVYDMTDVWLAIEGIMQRILAHYLDQKNEQVKEAGDKRELLFAERVSAAWTRKRPKKIQGLEFKFSNSTSTQVLNEYAAEERRKKFVDGGAAVLSDLEDMELKKICNPAMKNITMVYASIMKLCDKIDSSSSLSGKSCVLAIYINRFVTDVYLPSVESVVIEKIRFASRDDTMKLAPPGVLKALKEHNVKVLLNFYQAQRQIEDLCDLMYTMPLHSEKILAIIGKCVEEFLTGLGLTYQRICAYLPGKEAPESVRWSEDEQFCIFYRALPGWFYRKPADHSFVQSSATEYETIQKMYDGSHAEIMNDPKVLRIVALTMENCEWLSHMLDRAIKNFPVTDAANGTFMELSRPLSLIGTSNLLYPIPARYLEPLKAGALALMDFSEKCFLAVHWEIRIRCLHHLYKIFISSRLDLTVQDVCEEAERRVGLLVGDLWNISRTISHVVQENKFNFFYRSLGNLLRDIFIRSVDQMVKVNPRAVKCVKRCLYHLDEALTQMTGQREAVFDEVRMYFDIFLTATKPGDIVTHIIEQRRPFSEREYESAIRLVHRSFQNDLRTNPDSTAVSSRRGDHTALSWSADEEVDQLRRILASLTVRLV